jgi:hypothetical protein
MFSEKHDKGVVFYETVLSFKHQLHTFIEVVPIPWDLFNDIPAYFRVSDSPFIHPPNPLLILRIRQFPSFIREI